MPAITSAASLPSCVALCASIGWPTMSPMAKMCGTLVRICLSTGMKPRSLTVDAGLVRADVRAVGAAAHGQQHAVVGLRRGRGACLALEVRRACPSGSASMRATLVFSMIFS